MWCIANTPYVYIPESTDLSKDVNKVEVKVWKGKSSNNFHTPKNDEIINPLGFNSGNIIYIDF